MPPPWATQLQWIILTSLGAVGFALAVWAYARAIPVRPRRCQKCKFDMRGTPGLTCSECGVVATEHALTHARRLWGWVVLGGVMSTALPGYLTWNWCNEHNWTPPLPRYLSPKVYELSGGAYIEVRRARDRWDPEPAFKEMIGSDGERLRFHNLNCLVVYEGKLIEHPGGDGYPLPQHPLVGFHSFENNPQSRVEETNWIVTLEADGRLRKVVGEAGYVAAPHSPKDVGLVLKVAERRNPVLDGVTVPPFLLEWDGHNLVPALRLMRAPPPPEAAIQELIGKYASVDLTLRLMPRIDLMDCMLRLIYSGNSDVAWRIFDEAWREGLEQKQATRQMLEGALKQSAFAEELKRLQTEPTPLASVEGDAR